MLRYVFLQRNCCWANFQYLLPRILDFVGPPLNIQLLCQYKDVRHSAQSSKSYEVICKNDMTQMLTFFSICKQKFSCLTLEDFSSFLQLSVESISQDSCHNLPHITDNYMYKRVESSLCAGSVNSRIFQLVCLNL